jgi:hypothetical protein
MSSISRSFTPEEIVERYFVNNRGIVLGGPPIFKSKIDPGSKVFAKMLMPAPLVLITPGMPTNAAITEEEKKAELIIHEASMNTDITPDDSSLESSAAARQKTLTAANKQTGDFRYYTFTPATAIYKEALDGLLAWQAAKMGILGNVGVETAQTGGLYFYADKATTITESNTNTYGESMMKGMSKKISGLVSEFNFAIGKTGNDSAPDIEEAASSSLTRDGTFKKAASLFEGKQLIYPKKWEDSEFTRSYSLNFKFETPYGDAHSIYQFVYRPFLALLALGMPRQNSAQSYGQPFIVRVDAPGWFSIDMGVITDISIKKGDDDSVWTAAGLTRKMEVTVDIVDLYPALMLSATTGDLSKNISLIAYIDNLAGINLNTGGAEGTGILEGISKRYNTFSTTIASKVDVLGANTNRSLIQFLNKAF